MGSQELLVQHQTGYQELLVQHQTLPASSRGRRPAELLMDHHLQLPFEVVTSGLVSLEWGGTQKDGSFITPTSPGPDSDRRWGKLDPI